MIYQPHLFQEKGGDEERGTGRLQEGGRKEGKEGKGGGRESARNVKGRDRKKEREDNNNTRLTDYPNLGKQVPEK